MVIAFNEAVHEVHGFTERKKDLRKALSKISAGGGTALHDAIARAVLRLSSTQGTRVIIYLTDGADTASRLTLDDVVQQCVAEVVLVYGIGLGDVDQAALERLSEAARVVRRRREEGSASGYAQSRIEIEEELAARDVPVHRVGQALERGEHSIVLS